jgi:hypothetical protein
MMDCQKMNSSLQFLTTVVKLLVQRQQRPLRRRTRATMIVTMILATTTAKILAMTTATTVMSHQNLHPRKKSGAKKTTELWRGWRWHPARWPAHRSSETL